MAIQTRCYTYSFRGHQAFPESAGASGQPFVTTTTASSGTPTLAGIDRGGFRLGADSTNEAQNLCLSFGDVLAFNLADIIRASFIVKTTAALDSATSIAFGLASARNDAIDSIAAAALFRCIGSNDLVIETDDGTTNLDDKPTGFRVTDTWKRFEINFADQNTTISPPTLSAGRGSNLAFYAANDLGSVRRVASGSRFDMSGYAGGLQPFVQLQKTADSAADYLDVLEIEIETNVAA